MGGGYVLDFSNRTLQEFVADTVARDIYDKKYEYASCSKANRLRRFWAIEHDHLVGRLVKGLVDYAVTLSSELENSEPSKKCYKVVDRLLQGTAVDDLDATGDVLSEREFDTLVRSIRSAVDTGEPDAGIDRLHTFVTKFLRRVCQGRAIEVNRDKPLHSLLGEYIKVAKEQGDIETQMTERILKSSISIMESFNTVRNDHSLAHDNPVLNYQESLLILSHTANVVKFIQAVERKENKVEVSEEDAKADPERRIDDDDDLPF